jgi:hypothetical protein
MRPHTEMRPHFSSFLPYDKRQIGRFVTKDITRKFYREKSPLASLLLKWPLQFAALLKTSARSKINLGDLHSDSCHQTLIALWSSFSSTSQESSCLPKRASASPSRYRLVLFLCSDEMPFNFKVALVTCRSTGGKLPWKGFRLSFNLEISASQVWLVHPKILTLPGFAGQKQPHWLPLILPSTFFPLSAC